MSLRFASASTVSLAEFAAAFTAGFQGYQFHITMSAAGLARRVRFEQYDLENSLLAYDGAELAGMAALAVRGEAGWVAGFAVVPERRRSGVGRALMSALVERARACGLRSLSLEVLRRNAAARGLYEAAGMRVARDLIIMERTERPAGGALLPESPARELLEHFRRLHVARPAWQRDLPALLVGALRGFRLGPPDAPRAYALLGRALDGSHFLSDLAAEDAASARELCAGLAGLTPALKIVNEPADGLFIEPLLESGFTETERQHEMRMDL